MFKDKLCPRCGHRYTYIEQRKQGDRIYYYAVHEERTKNGKRRIRKCYLGPSAYIYVTRLHEKENLVFRGLLERNRAIEYLEAILQSLLNASLDKETKRQISQKLRFYADLLEKT